MNTLLEILGIAGSLRKKPYNRAALRWASRPYGQSAWTGKPVGIMGAATGVLGTARMQYDLRQCFVFLNMYPLNLPEVMITNSAQRFDQHGNLVDEATRDIMRKFLLALALWTRQVEHRKQIQA